MNSLYISKPNMHTVIIPLGSNVSISSLKGGMNYIEYTGSTPPEIVNVPKSIILKCSWCKSSIKNKYSNCKNCGGNND